MLRQIIFLTAVLLGAVSLASPAIWPEEFFGFQRTSIEADSPGQGPIWEEFGFEEGEVAEYARDGRSFRAEAWRFNDSTAAMAVYEWKCPAEARPTKLTAHSVEWDDGAFIAHGNYVFRFDGYKPTEKQIVGMLLIVPMLEQSELPTWVGFVPTEGIVPGSERFVIGPESLAEFEPLVPPSVAGFHFGVEAQLAEYQSPKGILRLGVFNYPTPHIARERLPEFRMLPGVVVKRSGPLLAVVFNSPDPNEAEKLLGRVNYRATITWDTLSVKPEPTLVEIVLTAFLFIGALFLMAIVLGALFGGLKFWRWQKTGLNEEPMTVLHLKDN